MKTRRRFFAFVMALVMALSLLPATVVAEELPVIPNIAINDGVVTWDAVDGAAEYYWSVGGGGGKVSSDEPLSVDLKDKLASFGYESDTYTFTIYARDAERTRLSQDWSCEYAYTSKGKLPAPTNLRWEDGLAKWDAVEHAQIYFVELFEEGDDSRLSYQYVTANECSFSVENGVKYEFRVKADASSGGHYEGYEDSDFSARSAAAVVRYAPKEDIANVKLVNGVLTWDAYDGAAGYYWALGHGGSYVAASEARSVDLRAYAEEESFSNGCYDVTLVAVDDLIYNGGIEISNKWKSPFRYFYYVGDERTEVASFTGTSDMVAPAYGDEVKLAYDFTFEGGIAGVPASMGHWEKYDGEEWQRYDGASFQEGTYRFTNQLRIDSDTGYGSTHKLAPVFSVTIDGKAWEQIGEVSGALTYTYAYMASPEFEVEWTPLPLVFTDSSLYDIGENYVGQPIPSYSVASAVVGGTPEYTFSKTAGAEWVNVSADGTVSGTPTASGNNVAVTIRVTDGAGLYEEIQVLVGFTQPDPATRETVRYIVGTSDMEEPELDGTVETVYDFTFTVGDMVNVPDSMGSWEKYDGEEWQIYDGATFTEGAYRYTNQVRIDGAAGHSHKLHESLQVTIDGKMWEQTSATYVANTYSYAYVATPVFVVAAPQPLVFTDNAAFDIGESYGGVAITPFSVADAVSGGTEPYIFSKVSGPAWITVAADGTISGTPTGASADYDELVVRVTDSTAPVKTQEITIDVARTWPNPADRSNVISITATSDIYTPLYGEDVEPVAFVMASGSKARFDSEAAHGWYKKDGENWVLYTGAKFVAGTYRYENTVIIDGNNGHEYKFAEPFTAKVDGKAWTLKSMEVEAAESAAVIYSPTVTVVAPNVINAATVTFDGDQLKNGCSRNLVLTVGDSSKYSAAIQDWYKGGTAAAPGTSVGTGGTFEGGNTYVLELVLTPAAGNIFAAGAALTVNGKSAQYVETVGSAVIYRVAFDAHKHTEKPVSGTPATCDEPGLTDGVQCSVCGDWIVTQEPIPKKGHTEKPVAGTPATCTKSGLTDGKKCSVCGVWTVKQEVIPKKAHTEKPIAGTPATCTKSGLTDGKKCSVCGTVTVKQQTILPVAHKYDRGSCTVCGEKDPNYVAVEGVDRVYGASRYETAFASADTLKKQLGVKKFSAAIVTSGDNFADALAGSYLAYVKSAPILLTDNDNIKDVMAYIQENVASGGTVYALGGKAVVTDKLFDLEKKGYDVKRLAGASRFETNLEILKECGSIAGKDILVCTGFNFADSLSASAAKRPILLVDDKLTDEQKAYLKKQSGCKYYIVGGTGAVTSSVEKSLKSYGTVKRLAGANRFDTSVMVAETFFNKPACAVLAYGYNFPDGLCAGPLAAAIDAPLILTATGDEAQAAAYAKEQGIKDGMVLGGPALISDKAVKKIFSMGSKDKITVIN